MSKKKESTPVRQSLATLFDKLMVDMNLKNDAALARAAKLTAPEICKARHAKGEIGPRLILKLHENLDIPVKMIRAHIKDMPA